MAKRQSLAEAAQDILSANVAAKNGKAEKFGAGYDRSYAPNPLQNKDEVGGGQDIDSAKSDAIDRNSGVKAASDAAPRATPPGATPPVGSEERFDIKRGSWDGKKRAKADDSGVVTEEPIDEGSRSPEDDAAIKSYLSKGGKVTRVPEGKKGLVRKKVTEEGELDEEGHSNFEKPTAHEIETLGGCEKKFTGKTGTSGVVNEEDDKDDDDKDDDDKKKDHDDDDDDDDDKKQVDEEGLIGDQHITLGPVEPVADIVKSYFKEKGALEEDVQAIFNGQDVTPEFVEKAKTIYEAAVIAKVTEIVEAIEEHYAEQVELVTESIKDQLADKVDSYLNLMVEEWVRDNEIAIEKGIRAELTEDFITGLRNLFVEHYIDIPDDKVNVVEELASKVEDLEGRLNEEVERGVALNKSLNNYKKDEIFRSVAKGLTESQIVKLKSLAESVDFTSEKEFKDKVSTIKENYFPTTNAKPAATQLDEESVEGDPRGVEEVVTDPDMELIAKTISKTLIK